MKINVSDVSLLPQKQFSKDNTRDLLRIIDEAKAEEKSVYDYDLDKEVDTSHGGFIGILLGSALVGFFRPKRLGRYFRTGYIFLSRSYRGTGIAATAAGTYFKTHTPGTAWIDDTNVASQRMFGSIGFVKSKPATYLIGTHNVPGHWWVLEQQENSINMTGKKNKLGQYSNETIDFQRKDPGIKALEQWCVDVHALALEEPKEWAKGFQAKATVFPELIKNRFGLTVSIHSINNPSSAAYVMPMYLSNRNVLLKDRWKGTTLPADMLRVIRAASGKEGGVNLKTARVSGLYSEYKHRVSVDFIALVRKYQLSPLEMLAVILHEIGHCFTTYEYADRIDTQNQVLASLLQALSDPKSDYKNISHVYREMVGNDMLTQKELDDILDSDSRVVYGSKLFAVLWKKSFSQSPVGKYDDTSSEQLADAFAARLGYYRELVTGLDKIHTVAEDPSKSRLGRWATFYIDLYIFWWRWYMITLLLFFTVFQYAGLGVGLLLSALVGFFLTAWLVFLSEGDDNRDMTYDELLTRYERIRHHVVELLKDQSLDTETVAYALKSMDEIKRLQADTTDYERFFTGIINVIKPAAANAKRDIAIQKLTEALSHNDLFVESAYLRSLV